MKKVIKLTGINKAMRQLQDLQDMAEETAETLEAVISAFENMAETEKQEIKLLRELTELRKQLTGACEEPRQPAAGYEDLGGGVVTLADMTIKKG